MIRQFWIWFYAVALVLLGLLFLALTLLWLSAFDRCLVCELFIVVPVLIWGWLLWVTWRLLKREIARSKG